MDQEKIGRFMADMRRQQRLTQREFADALGISDKTVSKWECGNGMPELSLMLPVCAVLKISLNELFSGERLSDADYRAKAEENMMRLIREAEKANRSIVGGQTLGPAATVDMSVTDVRRTNTEFWNTTGNDLLGALTLPQWSSFLPSEDELGLLGDLTGKSVLEIGCGNGRSLKYAADHGASDVWGLDISPVQLERARDFLTAQGVRANLVCSPMEDECSLPPHSFDLVFSVYSIGWTTDLDKTLQRIHSYLKKDGVFVFSWSHPIHKCVSIENNRLIFSNSYFNEAWYCADLDERGIILSNRMLSTYINALADHGFIVEKLVEETDREKARAGDSDFGRKALMLPTAFVIRAKARPVEGAAGL